MHTSFTDSTKLETFIHKTWSSNSNYKTWSGFDLTLINRLLLSKIFCRKIHVSLLSKNWRQKKFGMYEKIEWWLGNFLPHVECGKDGREYFLVSWLQVPHCASTLLGYWVNEDIFFRFIRWKLKVLNPF